MLWEDFLLGVGLDSLVGPFQLCASEKQSNRAVFMFSAHGIHLRLKPHSMRLTREGKSRRCPEWKPWEQLSGAPLALVSQQSAGPGLCVRLPTSFLPGNWSNAESLAMGHLWPGNWGSWLIWASQGSREH